MRKIKNSYEINKSIRRDWGAISPVTKVIPDKRRKPPKHKKKCLTIATDSSIIGASREGS